MSVFHGVFDTAQLSNRTALSNDLESVFNKVNCSVAVAESISLGQLSHQLSSLSALSSAFKGSVVCSSPLAFVQFCGVPTATLSKIPIDLECLSLDMCRGLLKRTQADICISNAGFYSDESHDNGTNVCISFMNSKLSKTKKIQCTGSPALISSKVAHASLVFLKQLLCKEFN